jgi:hypothetical protein
MLHNCRLFLHNRIAENTNIIIIVWLFFFAVLLKTVIINWFIFMILSRVS